MKKLLLTTIISRPALIMRPMEIVEVTGRKQFLDFVKIPFELHKDHPKWVPPLLSDEKIYFDSRKNPAFYKNKVKLFIAYEKNKAVGRVMGIINNRYNLLRDEKKVRFCCLEFQNDRSLAQKLLAVVEEFGRKSGMDKIVGPLGFSDQDPEGFLIEGFEYEPTLSTYYNFEYVPEIMEELGYTKEVDYVVYTLDTIKPLSEIHQRVFKRITSRKEIKFLEFDSKREMKPYIKPIMQIMNDSFTELYGFEPMTEKEIDFLVKRFLPIIDPRFVKTASIGGKLVGFLIAVPNINYGFRKCKGHLLPFGFLYIKHALKISRQLDLLAGGVIRNFRGQGLETWGLMSIVNSAKNAGYIIIDSHHELETNTRVRKVMEHFDGRLAKRFRVYMKKIQ